MARFLVTYAFEGESYALHIDAASWDEADRRLRALDKTGEVAGQVVASVWLPTGPLSWWRALRRWLRSK